MEILIKSYKKEQGFIKFSYILIEVYKVFLFFNCVNDLEIVVSTYTSELTKDSQTYSRICDMGKFHYETIEINTNENGIYGFQINSTAKIYGYIYKNEFDPFNPSKNLVAETNYTCSMYDIQLTVNLMINTTYELVVTTFDSDVRGPFSVLILGPNYTNINRTGKFLSTYAKSHISQK